MFILRVEAPPPPGTGPVRILGDGDRGNTTNTGRAFQHVTGQQGAPPPQIGGPPPAGPQAPGGDQFLQAPGAPGAVGPQQNQFQNFLLTLANAYRAAGPTGTVTENGVSVSVDSILNDPQNAAYRHLPQVQALITERNTQYSELKSRIESRMRDLYRQINNGDLDPEIETIRTRFAGDPQNGVLPQYGFRANAANPNQLDVIDAQTGNVLAYNVHQGTVEGIQPDQIPEIIRNFILKRETLQVFNNYYSEVRQRISNNPDLRATLDPNNPTFLSPNDINQIKTEVNQSLENDGISLQVPDITNELGLTQEDANKALWSSIEVAAVARGLPTLVQAGQGTGRLAALARWSSKFPGLARLNAAGTWLGNIKFLGLGRAFGVAGRALPWLGAGYACIDTGINGVNAISAACRGEWGQAANQGGRFLLKAGCMAAFCLIPGVGPLLGMTLGHLVGSFAEFLIFDGGAKKIWNGICSVAEKLGIDKAVKSIGTAVAAPFVAAGKAIKGLWNSIFG